jgi:hypothetical protein
MGLSGQIQPAGCIIPESFVPGMAVNPCDEKEVGTGLIIGYAEERLPVRHKGLGQGQVRQTAEIGKVAVKQVEPVSSIPGGIGEHPDPSEGIKREPLDRTASFRKGILAFKAGIEA